MKWPATPELDLFLEKEPAEKLRALVKGLTRVLGGRIAVDVEVKGAVSDRDDFKPRAPGANVECTEEDLDREIRLYATLLAVELLNSKITEAKAEHAELKNRLGLIVNRYGYHGATDYERGMLEVCREITSAVERLPFGLSRVEAERIVIGMVTDDKIPETQSVDWWRGHDDGATGTARVLSKVAIEGRNGGTFACSEIETAAKLIEDLRVRAKESEEQFRVLRGQLIALVALHRINPDCKLPERLRQVLQTAGAEVT